MEAKFTPVEKISLLKRIVNQDPKREESYSETVLKLRKTITKKRETLSAKVKYEYNADFLEKRIHQKFYSKFTSLIGRPGTCKMRHDSILNYEENYTQNKDKILAAINEEFDAVSRTEEERRKNIQTQIEALIHLEQVHQKNAQYIRTEILKLRADYLQDKTGIEQKSETSVVEQDKTSATQCDQRILAIKAIMADKEIKSAQEAVFKEIEKIIQLFKANHLPLVFHDALAENDTWTKQYELEFIANSLSKPGIYSIKDMPERPYIDFAQTIEILQNDEANKAWNEEVIKWLDEVNGLIPISAAQYAQIMRERGLTDFPLPPASPDGSRSDGIPMYSDEDGVLVEQPSREPSRVLSPKP